MATKARRPEATTAAGNTPTTQPAAAATGTKAGLLAKSVPFGLGTAQVNHIAPVPTPVTPTPWEFDLFVPWLAMLWEVPYVITVTKEVQAEYVNVIRSRKPSKGQSIVPGGKGAKGKKKEQSSVHGDPVKHGSKNTFTAKLLAINFDEQSAIDVKDSHTPSLSEIEINLTAYYDTMGNLVEMTINNSEAVLPKKLIHVLLVCAPFHHSLYKLTVRKITLRKSVMNYLAKYIQQSYLTDLVLDDSYLTNVDFFAIFDEITPLKHVSLARCRLGDDVVAGIAARLSHNQAGGKNLVLLNLTSTEIGDTGARALARMLRSNRQLCHLNLSGNYITDEGACAILDTLQEFPLSYEELVSSRARRMEHCAQKHVIYQNCLDEILEQRSGKKGSPSRSPQKKDSPKSDRKSKASPEAKNRKDDPKIVADEMARGIMGEFVDPFDALNMVKKDKYRFCMGNKRLCYLNLAYNNLHFPTLVKLLKVLEWQRNWPQPPVTQQPTGLMRVLLEGNHLPLQCEEQQSIDKILLEKTTYGADVVFGLGRHESSKVKRGVSARK